MIFIWAIAIYTAISIVVAGQAVKKKRFGFGWFMLSMLITPFFSNGLLNAVGRKKKNPLSGQVRKVQKSREEREFDAEWKVLTQHDKKIKGSMDYIEKCLYGTPALRKGQNELKAYYKATKSSTGLNKAAKRIVNELSA